jgi:thiol-disulfide isomerase/thioredoxin
MLRAACVLLAALLVAAPSGSRALQAGDVPPDALGRAASGEHVKLSDYRGKVVIISFWASWCGPCRKELPVLAGIQKQATTEHLQVLAVNFKEPWDRYQLIRRALKDAPLKLISDEDGSLGYKYGVKGIPHMVIIGRDGRIATVEEGYGNDEIPVLVKQINALLAEPATTSPP